jgi:hypothetical protein
MEPFQLQNNMAAHLFLALLSLRFDVPRSCTRVPVENQSQWLSPTRRCELRVGLHLLQFSKKNENISVMFRDLMMSTHLHQQFDVSFNSTSDHHERFSLKRELTPVQLFHFRSLLQPAEH